MKISSLHYAAIAALIALLSSAWLLPVSQATPSTYATAVALVIGAIIVTLMMWRNALPTDTIGQLLQRTESERGGRGNSAASGLNMDRR